MNALKYWVTAVSKEHSIKGVSGGFIQVCQGKQAPLKRMKKGDFIVIYSSKLTMEGKEKCQAFTEVGQVVGDEVYQVEMTANFKPFRRNIRFFECAEMSILPLIDKLEFISNKKLWGYPFRFGFFEINKNDFNLITSKMPLHEIKTTALNQ